VLQIRVRVREAPVRSHQYGEEKKKGVVITGGTKGLGFSLARELLAGDAKVVICGRNEEQLNAALDALQREFGGCAIQGVRCDVSDASDVAALASFAREALGTIHFWINNAGRCELCCIMARDCRCWVHVVLLIKDADHMALWVWGVQGK
jgi:NAD(P)-dependent dehydrogenase (short-subunit alcohol dehydrogenase family)